MTTYSTGNPVGSPDPRDLYDNAENLDEAINSTSGEWTDRLGRTRFTIEGVTNLATDLGTAAYRDTVGTGDVYARNGIIGTVSQSGGTPTGAIIERGSNANGEYTKFADGTLICMAEFSAVTINGGTDRERIGYSLPVAFINTNYFVSVDIDGWFASNLNVLSGATRSVSVTESTFDHVLISTAGNANLNSGSYSGAWIAIGRWY